MVNNNKRKAHSNVNQRGEGRLEISVLGGWGTVSRERPTACFDDERLDGD